MRGIVKAKLAATTMKIPLVPKTEGTVANTTGMTTNPTLAPEVAIQMANDFLALKKKAQLVNEGSLTKPNPMPIMKP